MMSLRRTVPVIFSLLLLLGFVQQASKTVQAKTKGIRNSSRSVSQELPFSVYLPAVSNDRCVATKTEKSPFSLQIAALHQVSSLSINQLDSPAPGYQSEENLIALFDASFPSLLSALEESGAGGTRIYISWSQIEKTAPGVDGKPIYSWKWYDEKLSLIAKTGIQIIATVADAPSWAAPTPCSPMPVNTRKQFARFLSDLVKRYKVEPYNITHWELINEPDNTWADGYLGGLGCWGTAGSDYAAMLQEAYPAVKKADPSATVITGGIANDWFSDVGGRFYRYFQDKVMETGGAKYFDVFNFHYFPDFHSEWERWDASSKDRKMGWLPAPTCGDAFDGAGKAYEAGGLDVIAKTKFFRNRMQTCYASSKPIWITELAEHGYENDPASLNNQASYLIKGFARALAAGVQNVTWYALATPNDSYQQGLLYDDLSPKPAFYAYKTLTSELKNYQFSKTVSAPKVEGYVFQDECGYEKVVFWGIGRMTFQNASQVRLVDKTGEVSLIGDGGAGDMDQLTNRWLWCKGL